VGFLVDLGRHPGLDCLKLFHPNIDVWSGSLPRFISLNGTLGMLNCLLLWRRRHLRQQMMKKVEERSGCKTCMCHTAVETQMTHLFIANFISRGGGPSGISMTYNK
jgi:hypothetical protein